VTKRHSSGVLAFPDVLRGKQPALHIFEAQRPIQDRVAALGNLTGIALINGHSRFIP
jgi:hypothetical protein